MPYHLPTLPENTQRLYNKNMALWSSQLPTFAFGAYNNDVTHLLTKNFIGNTSLRNHIWFHIFQHWFTVKISQYSDSLAWSSSSILYLFFQVKIEARSLPRTLHTSPVTTECPNTSFIWISNKKLFSFQMNSTASLLSIENRKLSTIWIPNKFDISDPTF